MAEPTAATEGEVAEAIAPYVGAAEEAGEEDEEAEAEAEAEADEEKSE